MTADAFHGFDGRIYLVVSMSLEAALESCDPFSSTAARAHWERVRAERGW